MSNIVYMVEHCYMVIEEDYQVADTVRWHNDSASITGKEAISIEPDKLGFVRVHLKSI